MRNFISVIFISKRFFYSSNVIIPFANKAFMFLPNVIVFGV